MAKKNNYRHIQPKIEPKIEPKNDTYKAITNVCVRELPDFSSRTILINEKGKLVEVEFVENGWLKLKNGGYSKAEYYTKL